MTPGPSSPAQPDGSDPSMEEILASIRRILNEEEEVAPQAAAEDARAARVPPATEPVLVLDKSMMVPPPAGSGHGPHAPATPQPDHEGPQRFYGAAGEGSSPQGSAPSVGTDPAARTERNDGSQSAATGERSGADATAGRPVAGPYPSAGPHPTAGTEPTGANAAGEASAAARPRPDAEREAAAQEMPARETAGAAPPARPGEAMSPRAPRDQGEPAADVSRSAAPASVEPPPGRPSPSPKAVMTFDEPVAAPRGTAPNTELVAPEAAAAAASSLGSLVRTLSSNRTTPIHSGGPTLEDMVRTELRPLLKEWLDTHVPSMVENLVRTELRPPLKVWLDANLPSLVERLVSAEIQKVVGRAEP